MNEHPRPDDSILPHDAVSNGHRPHGQGDDQHGAPYEPLTPPRRFLLCLDDDLDSDQPLVETITPEELGRLDPAGVRGHGLETDDHALVSLSYPGNDKRDVAKCTSAESALSLFSRVWPLRLVFLDPA